MSGRGATRRLRRLLLVAVAAVAAAVGPALDAGRLGERLELRSVDARFSLRGDRPPPGSVVVVGIDDVTFDERAERWPFSRNTFAAALRQVAADEPRAIVYDVQFTEESVDEEADNALILATRRAGNVVLSTTEVGAGAATRVFGGVEGQLFARARVGNGLLPEDADRALRRLPATIDGLAVLSLVAVERATGRRVDRGPLGGDGTWIDYSGPPGHLRHVSFSRVLAGRFAAGTFRGRIVVIGAEAPTLQDLHATPRGTMSGPEIHAHAVDTLLRGAPLRSASSVVGVALALLLALLVPLASLWVAPGRALLAGLGAGVLLLVGAQVAFGEGRVVPVVAPLAGLLVGLLGTLLITWLTASVERARLRELFGRFVPEAVVADVVARASAGDEVRLGGERLEATVLFADLRGFTAFAEPRDPAEVIEVLNRYLTEMSDAVLDHGGTLVSYMGDGIMAVFGAPVPADDHADRALAAARAMLSRLRSFDAWMRERGHPGGFRMGIGLHSGPVMSGNVGSARRLEYAAIGDTTNTAARLEGMTKQTPYQLLLSEAVRERLAAVPDELDDAAEVEVRGRRARVRVWGLREPGAGAPAPAEPPATQGSS